MIKQLDLRLEPEQPILPLDRLELAASAAGITRVFLRRKGGTPAVPAGRIGSLIARARLELGEYLQGTRTFFTVPTDLSQVPAFEQSILGIAAAIPYGEVRTYKWIAEQVGQPDLARAVGNAMAGNPVPLLIPCHRVVRTDGGLGGYSFGLVRKESLLLLEQSTSPFVGCASTKIVCRRGCLQERGARDEDRLPFASREDAERAGYQMCTSCRPA